MRRLKWGNGEGIDKPLAIFTLIILSSTAFAKTIQEGHRVIHYGDHWSYEGETGPMYWGNLAEDHILCRIGTRQSPIDITQTVKAELPPLEFNYQPIPLVIENNGHTIKITADQGGTLKIGNESYKLLQFHTHTPSEVAINGKRSDMVIHLVHANSNDELAVVSVLLELGEANPLIQKLWEVMPKTVMPPQQSEVQIDINQLLPENKTYYTHWGSLTTPPCTEGVKWIILKQPISLSSEQLAQYREIYPHNARPLQPILTRYILSSD